MKYTGRIIDIETGRGKMKVKIKKTRPKKKGGKTTRVVKPRIAIPPNRTFKSKKDYNRKNEKDVSRRIREY
jgi:hypothetical protein